VKREKFEGAIGINAHKMNFWYAMLPIMLNSDFSDLVNLKLLMMALRTSTIVCG